MELGDRLAMAYDNDPRIKTYKQAQADAKAAAEQATEQLRTATAGRSDEATTARIKELERRVSSLNAERQANREKIEQGKAAAAAAKCSSAASLCAWIASSSPDALIQRAGGGRRAVGSGALGRRSVSTQLKPNISASSAPITIWQSSPLKLQQVIRNHDEISSQRETRAAYFYISHVYSTVLVLLVVLHTYCVTHMYNTTRRLRYRSVTKYTLLLIQQHTSLHHPLKHKRAQPPSYPCSLTSHSSSSRVRS